MSTEYKVKCLTRQESPVVDVDINNAIRSILDTHEQWSFWEMLAGKPRRASPRVLGLLAI